MKFVQDALDRRAAGTHSVRDTIIARKALIAANRNKTGPFGKFLGHPGFKDIVQHRNPGEKIGLAAGYDVKGSMVEQFFERVHLRSR